MEPTKQLKEVVLIDDDALTNFINKKIISLSFDVDVIPYTQAQAALDQFQGLSGSGC